VRYKAAWVDLNELLEKYHALLAESSALRKENELLKARLRVADLQQSEQAEDINNHGPLAQTAPELPDKNPQPVIPGRLEPLEKIRLFMALFKGREDVYARRWQNRENKAGYAPVLSAAP